ncbi:MAG: hypothetical protein IPN42_10405 [Methylococcaceae bacterium]|nr:hypothetical protein [Methylococcaceae bacterium]
MKYKFFAIPARFPEVVEAELNAFCSQHRICFNDKQLLIRPCEVLSSLRLRSGNIAITYPERSRRALQRIQTLKGRINNDQTFIQTCRSQTRVAKTKAASCASNRRGCFVNAHWLAALTLQFLA